MEIRDRRLIGFVIRGMGLSEEELSLSRFDDFLSFGGIFWLVSVENQFGFLVRYYLKFDYSNQSFLFRVIK